MAAARGAPSDLTASAPALALLVDTYSLFFRAHFALPPMNTRSGEPTAALYGFSAALLAELARRQPLELAFAVDAPQRTFRHERQPSYKAHRDPTPEPLVAQLGRLRELLAAFEVPVYQVPGVEADDVLATLAARLSAAGREVLIMSGDRDLLQTVGERVRVLFVGARGQKPVIYDAARVEQRFSVPPGRLPTYVALVGDASDNLPRVPGVGPRTACRWVREHGSAALLVEHAATLEPARLGAEVLARAAQVLESELLATLRRDVPLAEGPLVAPLSAAAWRRLGALFSELEFKSLGARLAALSKAPFEA
ncbi:MAG TPA: 5'-3' exonuclease H3TH domain-containing protein [Polyangiaceae bacterium]|nr:5'-3' exonuclease H3TH domain-containing protein [Polyangiaceae bacterium]